jgi:hypothetical protein
MMATTQPISTEFQPPRQDATAPANTTRLPGVSQNAGGGGGPNNRWYNPLPDPYGGVFPSNGAEIYNGFGGMGGYGMMGGYPGGMGGYGMGMGGYPGGYGMGFGAPGVAGNVWGGYDTGSETDGNRIPGYGYNDVVDASVFQKSLSGNGELNNNVKEKIYQEHFMRSNDGFVLAAVSALGGGAGFLLGNLSIAKINNLIPRFKLPPVVSTLASLTGAAIAGTFTAVKTAPKINEYLAQKYVGLDYADNGTVDGSWTVQKEYDVSEGLF